MVGNWKITNSLLYLYLLFEYCVHGGGDLYSDKDKEPSEKTPKSTTSWRGPDSYRDCDEAIWIVKKGRVYLCY
jgi:hypothetical protein